MRTQAAAIAPIVERYLRGESSVLMTAMELIQHTGNTAALRRILPTLGGDQAKLGALVEHLADNDAGCRTIVGMIGQRLDSPEPAGDIDEGIARCRTLFDASVAVSEESSVALYSLGNPELLAAATDEVIGVMDDWGVFKPGRDALEIGCGIGRLMLPVSSRVRSVTGTDVAPGMIAAATRRLAACPNACVLLTDGRDLSGFAAASMDLVYSVDTFPYLVRSGRALVERHVEEVGRVLRPGGDFVLFNYVYGRSREDANGEVIALAQHGQLHVVRADEAPFHLWNGIGWLLRRGPTA